MPSSKDSFQALTAQAKPKSQCSVAVIIISEECHIFSWSASPLEFLKNGIGMMMVVVALSSFSKCEIYRHQNGALKWDESAGF